MNALDIAYGFGAVVLAPLWARKKRDGWNERMGRLAPLPPAQRARILLHAVSVGEVSAIRGLVDLLTPHAEVVVSVSTDTGIARARELFAGSPSVTVVRYPLDFSAAVERFLDAVRPNAVALTELEVWPNFVSACKGHNVPVGVINGRLSDKSFRGYQRIRPLLKRTFASLAFAGAQDETYASRFTAMGVPADRVFVTDTMKWDTGVITDEVSGADDLARQMGIDRTKPLIVAGSTAAGEEALLHAACPPGTQLLCAPRKPERFDEAAAAMPGCIRRVWSKPGSTVRKPPAGLGSAKSRFLLDTIGELRAAYALADIAVIGRSFGTGQGGGSDPIEPLGLGKPVVIGQDFANFQTVVNTLRKAGGLQVISGGELRVTLGLLLKDPDRRAEMAAKGRACIRLHQGATQRHADLILGLVTTPGVA